MLYRITVRRYIGKMGGWDIRGVMVFLLMPAQQECVTLFPTRKLRKYEWLLFSTKQHFALGLVWFLICSWAGNVTKPS